MQNLILDGSLFGVDSSRLISDMFQWTPSLPACDISLRSFGEGSANAKQVQKFGLLPNSPFLPQCTMCCLDSNVPQCLI